MKSEFLGIEGYHQDSSFTRRDLIPANLAKTIRAKHKPNFVLAVV